MVYYRQHNAIEWEKAKWDAEVEVRKGAKVPGSVIKTRRSAL